MKLSVSLFVCLGISLALPGLAAAATPTLTSSQPRRSLTSIAVFSPATVSSDSVYQVRDLKDSVTLDKINKVVFAPDAVLRPTWKTYWTFSADHLADGKSYLEVYYGMVIPGGPYGPSVRFPVHVSDKDDLDEISDPAYTVMWLWELVDGWRYAVHCDVSDSNDADGWEVVVDGARSEIAPLGQDLYFIVEGGAFPLDVEITAPEPQYTHPGGYPSPAVLRKCEVKLLP